MMAAFATFKRLWDPTGRAEPGQHRRPRTAAGQPGPRRREPAGVADDFDLTPDQRTSPVGTVRPRRPGVHRRGPLPRLDRRGDVPQLPRHRRREGLDPRPCPRPAGDGPQLADRRGRMALGGRQGIPRPLPVLQGLLHRLPGRRGHGHVQVRVPRPPLPRPAASAVALLARAGCPVLAEDRRTVRPVVNVGSPQAGWRKVAAQLGGLTTAPVDAGVRVPASRSAARSGRPSRNGAADVVVLVDTFTRGFRPEVAGAASRVLAEAGPSSQCAADVCCGLTWISTGQLRQAKKTPRQGRRELLDDGTDRPIVVLEPSCAAAFRKDLPELVHTDAARRVAARVQSFAGAVARARPQAGWTPSVALPDDGHRADPLPRVRRVRRGRPAEGPAGGRRRRVREATGCCGVAGNFGFEADHYDLSMQVAEQALAPALRDSPEDAVVLTDGFSCHMQVRQLDPTRSSQHLAQLLDPAPPSKPEHQSGD